MIENINPLPSGVRKLNKRMVVSAFIFIFLILLVVLFLMTLAERKSTQRQSAAQDNTSGFISQDKINVQSLELLPDKYSDVKQQPPNEPAVISQTSGTNSPPEKVFIKQPEDPTEKNKPKIPEKNDSHTPISPQYYLPSTPAHDIRPGANYQHRSEEEIEKEKALKSKLMFFGSGTKASQTKTEKGTDAQLIQSNSDLQRQAMLNDLIDRMQPDQTLSETRTDQQSKKEYFHSQNQGTVYLNQRIQDPVSPYQLMAGTVLPAVLISGINSDLPGHIIAQIRENVFDTVQGRYLLVPQGTKLLGSYDNMVSWGQDKVMLVWSRLIMPDGATIVLDNMPGVDVMGYAGLKDKVNNHYMKIASAILMSTFLSVGTRRIAGEVNGNDPTFGQEMASHASADINQAGQKIVTRHLNVPPTLEIRPGFPFNVMVNKDIILRPYEK